jgi:hypothetical protein
MEVSMAIDQTEALMAAVRANTAEAMVDHALSPFRLSA